MSEIGFEILVIFLLILLNGLFVTSETAIFASRKARLQHKANEGDRKARTALDLAATPNRFLPTVQIGITLIGVLTGAVGGAVIGDALAEQFAQIPALARYGHSLALAIIVLLITFLSLLLGELVPKRLALHNPERIAAGTAGLMFFISKVLSPVVWLLGKSTDFVLRLLGIRPSEQLPVTEEELQVLLEQGTQAGVFEEAEQDMVEGVFSLSDRRVNALMSPRNEIIWLDANDPPEEIRRKMAESPYSRFPVCVDSLDQVLGVIKAKDLLLAGLCEGPVNLKNILQPATFIPETAFGSRALEMFKEGKAEIMLVIDEFGVVQGLLTLSDILEEIVGGLATEEPQATQRQDGSWLLDGMLSSDEFKEIFNLRKLPDEAEYETLGGFMMLHLGRIPLAGDKFEWGGLRFEVMDMDGNRVDKLLVTTLPIHPVEKETRDGRSKT
ncbi:MAG: hemolysin family protein [Anaerolineales bacterium]|nr:hemolysin family protein [Anaerolineales bacterium]